MELPVRILAAPPADPVVLVDGVFDARGLNLSHWPGHRTPAHLRHDLSTGSALAFARLPPDERAGLAAGCVAIANNHYDTDGTCALFAARFPERALPRAERLLACARAGDFFQLPDLDAFRVDAVVSALAEEGSPLPGAGLDDLGRWQRCTDHLMEALPGMLDGDLAPYRALFADAEARLVLDLAELERAERAEDAALDLCVLQGGATFAPGRHAFHGRSERDRVLVLGAGAQGTTARLAFSTLSWFDLASGARLPRPDLEALAAELNVLEGTDESANGPAWRAQSTSGAAPELWFGLWDVPRYAEHNERLALSALGPARIEAAVRAALSAALPIGP